MEFERIDYTVKENVGVITLTRPDVYNVIVAQLRLEVDEAISRAVADDEVRCILIQAEGRNFSAGHGLAPEDRAQYASSFEKGVRGRFGHTYDGEVQTFLRWKNVPKPTVCAVQGYCIFAGWMFASPLDIIFAADDALFLSTMMNYFPVPWQIGSRKTKELLFESRFMTGEEAMEAGLVNRVFPRHELHERAFAYCARVAKTDPLLARMVKTSCNNAEDAQGFVQAIKAAHGFYTLEIMGKRDTDALPVEGSKDSRHPMVTLAFQNLREGDV